MAPENKPQFSHITVGQGPAAEVEPTDEEFVRVGAVDLDADDVRFAAAAGEGESIGAETGDDASDAAGAVGDASDAAAATAADDATSSGVGPSGAEAHKDRTSSTEKRATDGAAKAALDEAYLEEFGGPMPTAQKVVIACCIVGFVVAIALIVVFWLA